MKVNDSVPDKAKKHEYFSSAHKVAFDFLLNNIMQAEHAIQDKAERACRCYVHLSNPNLLTRLGNSSFTAAMRSCIDIHLVNSCRAIARHLVCERIFGAHLPAYRENGVLRFVVLGLGSLGQQIIIQLAQMAHAWNVKTIITVMDKDNEKLIQFKKSMSVLTESGEQTANTGEVNSGGFSKVQDIEIRYYHTDPLSSHIDTMIVTDPDLIANVFIAAMGEEAENIAAVSRIMELISKRNAAAYSRIYVRVKRTDGATAGVLGGKLAPESWKEIVEPFGITSPALSSYLTDRRGDYIASILHRLYLANSLAPNIEWLKDDNKSENKNEETSKLKIDADKIEAAAQRTKLSCTMWNMLAEEFRDSNRLQADHLFVKMWMLGLKLTDMINSHPDSNTFAENSKNIKKLTKPGKWHMVLAETEHNRWNADKLLAGYKYGETENKDGPEKTHDCLIRFDELKPDVMAYDENHIRELHIIISLLSTRASHGFS
jgi:hypothetical protein